jgi:uncharacterized membrane protein YkvA (DUF1232 family)
LAGVIVVLLAACLAFVLLLWLHRPGREMAAVSLRLLPDVARLVFRLVRDPRTPRRYRLGLIALGAYLAFPIDVIPDFLPGVGALDDVILALLVLRWVGRGVPAELIVEHWSGSPQGLAFLERVRQP